MNGHERVRVTDLLPAPRLRSRWLYQVALALPLVTISYLTASGRLAAFWRPFVGGAFPTDVEFEGHLVSALLWSVATLPLVVCAWDVGRQHTRGRRIGYELIVGLREVTRHALGRSRPSTARAVEFARAPRDDPQRALAWGACVAIALPAFFSSFIPWVRTPGGAVWLAGAGVIMGSMTYFRRRAMAYLTDEPGRWDMLREWRLLNADRYAPAGRRFVWGCAISAVLLPIWWLVIGVLVAFPA